jgi:hypothetical protein
MHLPLKSFHYIARIEATDISSAQVVVRSRPACSQQPPYFTGSNPTLRFLEDKVVMITVPDCSAPLKWCSFHVGDAIPRAGRADDVVEISRDSDGALVVRLFRHDRLVLAVGALLGIDLGTGPRLTRLHHSSQVEVHATDRSRILATRESVEVDGYDVYVEVIEPWSIWGIGPSCMSVTSVEDPVVVTAARRSATIMADRHRDPLCGEALGGRMLKSRYDIDSVWMEVERG